MDTNKLSPKVEAFLEKYLEESLLPIFVKHFTKSVESSLATTKKASLAERFNEQGGLFGIAGNLLKNSYNKYKDKKANKDINASTATEQPKDDNTLKTVDNTNINTAVPEQVKAVAEPVATTDAPKGKKHLIKDDNISVMIGGISVKGVQNLRRSLPLVFKPILDDFFKRLGSTELKTNIKQTAAAPAKDDSGQDNGLLGAAWDFFKKKKGTVAGDFARNRKAAQLRKARALRTTENTLKTTATTTSKEAVEVGAKTVGKEAVESGIKSVGTEAVESGIKSVGTEAVESGAKVAAESGGKNVLKQATGKIGKVASLAAAAGGSVKSKIAESIAKRIPKAMAGAIGKSIPFLGELVGAGFAVSRLLKGDYVGAGLEAVSGLGSAATAIPATALLTAKDVYEDAYGVKPESDPKVGERFTEIKDATTKAATDFVKGVGEKNKPKEEPKKDNNTAATVTPTTGSTPTETDVTAAPVSTTNTPPASTPDIAATTSPAVQPSVPSVQPVPTPTPTSPTSTGTDNGHVLNDISDHTSKTNDLLGALTQAIMKLAQKPMGAVANNSSVSVGGQSSPQPSASEIMANNSDPIRSVRSKYGS